MAKRKTVHGSGVFTGAWLSPSERGWLNERARLDGLTVSQVLRKTVRRALASRWTFGDEPPTLTDGAEVVRAKGGA